MKAITLYIGLDVHKDSITTAIAKAGPKGDIRLFGAISQQLFRRHQGQPPNVLALSWKAQNRLLLHTYFIHRTRRGQCH